MTAFTELEGWEPELPEQEITAEWPEDMAKENAVWKEPPYDVEDWEYADSEARSLGYRDYDEYYWSYDGPLSWQTQGSQ